MVGFEMVLAVLTQGFSQRGPDTEGHTRGSSHRIPLTKVITQGPHTGTLTKESSHKGPHAKVLTGS